MAAQAAPRASAAASAEMSLAAFGTMEYVDGSRQPEALYEGTLAALKAGFRHLDCAELYSTTPHVGRAIADSKVPRSELWVTSKLKGLPTGDYDTLRARLVAHLEALRLDRLDLLLVHWPACGPARATPSRELLCRFARPGAARARARARARALALAPPARSPSPRPRGSRLARRRCTAQSSLQTRVLKFHSSRHARPQRVLLELADRLQAKRTRSRSERLHLCPED